MSNLFLSRFILALWSLFTLTGLTLSPDEWSCILSGLFNWLTSSPQDPNSEADAVPWYSKLWHVKHILAESNPFGAYRSQYSGACYKKKKKESFKMYPKQNELRYCFKIRSSRTTKAVCQSWQCMMSGFLPDWRSNSSAARLKYEKRLKSSCSP